MEESYDKVCTELTQLLNEWYRFIKLTVISKEPQPQSSVEREILKQEIDSEMKRIDEYKEMVDQLKFKNLNVFEKTLKTVLRCARKHTD